MRTTNGVELVVMFGDRARFYEFLRELDRGEPLEKTMVRSRLSENGGWMRLTLSGPAARVDEIVRVWGDAITSFKRLEKAS